MARYQDETAELCQWHVNEAHYLESWGDARAYDGTVTIVQPLIAPLYSGKSAHELVALLAGQAEATGLRHRAGLLEEASIPAPISRLFWRKSLHDGWDRRHRVSAEASDARRLGNLPARSAGGARQLEINFRRDPSIYDGRFCQQRLAAGAAEADDQDDLGQSPC